VENSQKDNIAVTAELWSLYVSA